MHVYNLGTGVGYSVLDMIHAFEKACGKTLPYAILPRRAGRHCLVLCLEREGRTRARLEGGVRHRRDVPRPMELAEKQPRRLSSLIYPETSKERASPQWRRPLFPFVLNFVVHGIGQIREFPQLICRDIARGRTQHGRDAVDDGRTGNVRPLPASRHDTRCSVPP